MMRTAPSVRSFSGSLRSTCNDAQKSNPMISIISGSPAATEQKEIRIFKLQRTSAEDAADRGTRAQLEHRSARNGVISYGCVSSELKAMRPGLAFQESPIQETDSHISAYGVYVCGSGDMHPSLHSQLQLAGGAGALLHPESNAYRTTHSGL